MSEPTVNDLPTLRDFKIAVICALDSEAAAVQALFEKRYLHFKPTIGRNGAWKVWPGRIGGQDLVLLLVETGIEDTIKGFTTLRNVYENVDLAFVVGVCGGVPKTHNSKREEVEVILGDVVISTKILPYGSRKQNDEGIEITGKMKELRRRFNAFNRTFTSGEDYKILEHNMHVIMDRAEKGQDYPGIDKDICYDASYPHASGSDCSGCDTEKRLSRLRLSKKAPRPAIHFGIVASGSTVMKSATHRDEIANLKECKGNLVGFEMEGAGICDEDLDVIVIKGVCDYADSHKNKDWQSYSAFTASAAFGAFIKAWGEREKGTIEKLRDRMAESMTGPIENTARKVGLVREKSPGCRSSQGQPHSTESNDDQPSNNSLPFPEKLTPRRSFLEFPTITVSNHEKSSSFSNTLTHLARETMDVIASHPPSQFLFKQAAQTSPYSSLQSTNQQCQKNAQLSQGQPSQGQSSQVQPSQAGPSPVLQAQETPAPAVPSRALPAQTSPVQTPSAQLPQNQNSESSVLPIQVPPGQVPQAQEQPYQALSVQEQSVQTLLPQESPCEAPPAQPSPSQARSAPSSPSQAPPTRTPVPRRPAQASPQSAPHQEATAFPLTPDSTPDILSMSSDPIQQHRPGMQHFPPHSQFSGAQPLTPPQTPPLPQTDRSSSIASESTIFTQDAPSRSNSTAPSIQQKVPVTEVPEFIKACQGRIVIAMKELLQHKPIDLDSAQYGCTMLHLVIGTSIIDKEDMALSALAAKELISYGANLNAEDSNGARPLHYCALTNNIEVAKLLLDKSLKGRKADVRNVDRRGQTALNYLAEAHQPAFELGVLLVKKKAKLGKGTTIHQGPRPTQYQRDIKDLIVANKCYE